MRLFQGVKRRMILVVIFYFFVINCVCFVVAMSDIVHDVEASDTWFFLTTNSIGIFFF